MKLLTFNLWDSPAGMPVRAEHIQETLRSIQADVLCLQEVPDRTTLQSIADICACPYSCFHPEAGTAVLSGILQIAPWEHSCASAVCIPWKTFTLQVVSIHLPWNSARRRECAIAEIVRLAAAQHADYTILAGDFNCSDTSDVHRFLTGDCSLADTDAYYFDLALSRQAATGIPAGNTLDFRHNPRWGTYEPENTIEIPQRFDRIYLSNPYPNPMPNLTDCRIFGTEIHSETGLCPSDHYGVTADLQF